ncbi:MAG: Txe/YoeB family addiction module toxin [Ruminococcus sp.]|jgi:Txe/YoeB family toxin of toxin-antitoxin system|nr:Txe/YoeB family addiction module toxin [Ruminococcus sp.]
MKFTKKDVLFSKQAQKQLDYCSQRNKRMHNKIRMIIDDILEFGYGGHFRPEMLSGNFSGACSKEVDKKNRVVFQVKDNKIYITQVMGHYNDH